MGVPKPVWIVLPLLGLAYFIWGGPTASETFRYKLTINVTVDGRPYSASSVIEATQRQGSCLIGNARCIPSFSAKGVAPMIMLPDGAVIFASLSGYVDKEVGGRAAARLPWLIYLDTWPRGNIVARLPEETPRVEIPFEGHPKSKMRPPMFWVPPQELGPAVGTFISNQNASAVAKRSVSLKTFVIELTDDRLVECIENGPSWVAAYKGGPRLPKEVTEQRRFDQNRPIDKQSTVPRFDTCDGRYP